MSGFAYRNAHTKNSTKWLCFNREHTLVDDQWSKYHKSEFLQSCDCHSHCAQASSASAKYLLARRPFIAIVAPSAALVNSSPTYKQATHYFYQQGASVI